MFFKSLVHKSTLRFGALAPHRIFSSIVFARCVAQRSCSTTASKYSTHRYTAHRDRQYIVLQSDNTAGPNVPASEHRFPLLWLRDNCQCPECFHSNSKSRIIDWTRFDVNVQPADIVYNNDDATLLITWSDAHRTAHTFRWLRERLFEPAAQQDYARNGYRPAREPWTPETFDAIAYEAAFDYSDLLTTAAGLRDWLQHLAVHGVAIIRGAPTENEHPDSTGRSTAAAGSCDSQPPSHHRACRRLAERVAFIRRTLYGDEFHVRHAADTSNVAYLAGPLQMHTDLPYYEHVPGVNLLHCVEQSRQPNGAFNLLCDGLAVAERMRREWPAEFRRLSETPVDWLDVGEDECAGRFHTRFRAPVICLNADGSVHRINHSVPQRDSRFTCAAGDVDGWYRALARFVQLIDAGSVRFRTQPGDILTFDNTRLVHGRTAYRDSGTNVRHVIGAYLDWDEIYSRLRVLNESLGAAPKCK